MFILGCKFPAQYACISAILCPNVEIMHGIAVKLQELSNAGVECKLSPLVREIIVFYAPNYPQKITKMIKKKERNVKDSDFEFITMIEVILCS